jgi:hypothetical protein
LLKSWLELDTGIALLAVPVEFAGAVSKRLSDTVLAVHAAMPFNEAERAWIYAAIVRTEGSRLRLPQKIESQEGTIMVAGIRRPVSGHDLMSRWLAWRRQTDEYDGQGSLDQARAALLSLQAQLGTCGD